MRWRLTAPHYLNVLSDPAEWEYKETNRDTGRQARKVFRVPTLLDPDDPTVQNRLTGEVVVCYEGKGSAGDYTIACEPTPDMEPLDDEAKALSDSLRPKWSHPIESLPANGSGEDFAKLLIKSFERQMQQLTNSKELPAVSANAISAEAFAELQKQVQQLAAQNVQLLAQQSDPKAPAARRA